MPWINNEINVNWLNDLRRWGFIRKKNKKIHIEYDNIREMSIVVSEEMFDNFTNVDWLREQRAKLGLIKVNPETERKKNLYHKQMRRKHRAYNLQQRAKRLAQPREELPLDEILL